MLSSKHLKYLKSLSKKKYRLENQQFIVEGYRAVQELLKSKNKIEKLYTTDEFLSKNSEIKKDLDQFNFDIISEINFNKIVNTKSPQHIMALVHMKPVSKLAKIKGNVLLLDDISDPGNMGTLLRTSAWYGIKNVFCSINSVDIYNPKVIRSAMGAHFYIDNLNHIDISKVITNLKKTEEHIIISSTLDAPSDNPLNIKNKFWALILGNEAHGIKKDLIDISDYKIFIPRIGSIESLNVAVAGSIIVDQLITN